MDKKKIISVCLAAFLSVSAGSSVPASWEIGAEEETKKLISCDFESGLSGWSGRGSAAGNYFGRSAQG